MFRDTELIRLPGRRRRWRDALTGAGAGARWREVQVGRVTGLQLPMRAAWRGPLAALLAVGAVAEHGWTLLHDAPTDTGVWGIGFAGIVLAVLLVEVAQKLFAHERISVEGGMLTVRVGIGPIARTWRYRVADIADLQAWEPEGGGTPFMRTPRTGAIYFNYRDKETWIARELDEAEGEEVAFWLARRLPASASLPCYRTTGG